MALFGTPSSLNGPEALFRITVLTQLTLERMFVLRKV